jgi:hypothetical protein
LAAVAFGGGAPFSCGAGFGAGLAGFDGVGAAK